MSINPITVERLKTFVMFGHSNGDGWASSVSMVNEYSNLYPTKLDHYVESADNYYKNIYVATSAQPWAGDFGTPVPSDIGDVAWLELTTNFPSSPAAPHPHPSPYVYPNNRGSCYPHWFYAFRLGSLSDVNGSTYAGTLMGAETPLSYAWLHHWQEQVGIVKVAFSASLFLRYERGGPYIYLNPNLVSPDNAQWQKGSVDDTNFDYIGYWTPSQQFDFAPATDRLYKKWYDKMVGAQAALAPNTKMDVRLIVPWMGDNDSETQTREALELSFEKGVREFIKRVRQDCVDNDWTTLPAHQIPIVWPGVFTTYDNGEAGFDSVGFCNEALQRIAADDPYMRWVDSSGWETLEDDGFTAVVGQVGLDSHFGHNGYFHAAEDIYAAFCEIEVEPFDAIAEEDRVTLSELKDRVRTYYNRARVQTDVDDDLVLIHINGALNSILGAIGDNAYWLRRRHMMNLTFSVTEPVEMPKYVSRVIKIERPTNPKYPIQFTQVGFASGGKLQILVQESPGGNVYVDYIYRPRDMTRDEELVPLPRQYIEWLSVEACRRMARSGSNVALQASLEGEARTLQERCMKDMAVMQRAKHDRLRTQRRNVTLGYRRGIQYPWGNDISR